MRADQHGLPLAITVEPASPHESRLVGSTLAASFLDEMSERLIGDRADRGPRELRSRRGTATGSTANWPSSSASR